MTATTALLNGTYVADVVHSKFSFAVKHMKIATFSAAFDDFDTTIVIGDEGATIDGAIRVESVSIKSPPEFREHVVNGPEFFDAKTYPEIKFHSSDVDLESDGTATVSGQLTIKGVSAPFVAVGTYQSPVEDPFGLLRSAVEFTTTVDRRDWELNWQTPMPKGGDVLAWEVQLKADLELVKRG
jgi:polyisoprenoid-binding protein YceI